MADVIKMPLMSDTMEEGVILEWHKKVGDKVEPGDILAEVETDKATMELENYHEGVLLFIGVEKGTAVKVDGVLAVIGEEGEDFQAAIDKELASNEAVKEETPKAVKEETAKVAAPVAIANSNNIEAKANTNGVAKDSRIKASPLAKRIANDNNITIGNIAGSGDNGRIIKKDVENYLKSGAAQTTAIAGIAAAGIATAAVNIALPTIVAEEQFEEIPVTQMRKTIAKRLGESKFDAPHFYLTIDILMDKAIEARKAMNEISQSKISFNDIVIKAAALALRTNPYVNASWLGDKIRLNKHIHVGMAVAVAEGLLVPVIKFADNKSLTHIAVETKDLGGKAKSKKLGLDEMQGNTFTISNLGMMGIEQFTAIINPPDVAIMAVGGIRKSPSFDDAGNLKIENRMKVTLSCDHRVVDGAVGSKFLQTFKGFVENPVSMLV